MQCIVGKTLQLPKTAPVCAVCCLSAYLVTGVFPVAGDTSAKSLLRINKLGQRTQTGQ